MAFSSQDQQAIIDAHNAYRSDPAVNAPKLQWDSTLATGAQAWADNLAATKTFAHSNPSDRQGLGENIAKAGTGSNTATQWVDMWGKTVVNGRSEQAQFKPGIMQNVSKDGGPVGHYTQMIWNKTTSVGCGIASDGTNDYVVCRYSPQGNVTGMGCPSPQPVTLVQVSVASATLAAGVDAANNVYYYMSNDNGTTWTPQYQITGQQMKQVSVADDLTICGLDTSGAIWQGSFTTGVTWTKMAAGPAGVTFVTVSCGSANNIWAVGSDTYCYQNTGSGWTKIVYLPGAGAAGGTVLSVAADGTTWWCDNRGMPARYTGTTWDWSVSSATGWTFPQLSCGSATNVWTAGSPGPFYKLADTGKSWTSAAPGTGKQVSVASDGTVWSIGADNLVYRLVNNAWTKLLV
ncbi:MAG TPA: CAP domain-containing protein [Ktedonobacteraceae bacterium]|nr:CAP domain-containing protein [Ktedonobacteraceae bacterium]